MQMQHEIIEKQKTSPEIWRHYKETASDLAYGLPKLCTDIPVEFIANHCIPKAEIFILAYTESIVRRKPIKQYRGFCILNNKPDQDALYLQLICANKCGKYLIEQVEGLCTAKNISHISLSALPQAIYFYRKHGFKNTENMDCIEHDEVIKSAKKDLDTFLKTLIKYKIVANKNCKNIVECNVDGYLMTKCLNDA